MSGQVDTWTGPTRFAELLAELPESWLDREAVIGNDTQMTYRELRTRARSLAHALRAAGVTVGQRVGVIVGHGPALPVALLGTLLAGACCVPIDPEFPDARARELCLLADLRHLVGDHHARRLHTTVPRITHVRVDGPPPADPGPLTGLHRTDVDPAFCFFTSGSTGTPKGVVHGDESLLARQRWEQNLLRLNQDDRVLLRTSIAFNVIMRELFWPLMVGATVVLAGQGRTRDPRHLLDVINRFGVTLTSTSPSLLSMLLRVWRPGDANSLRYVLCGGETLTTAMVNEFHVKVPGAQLHNCYGLTEACTATHWRCRPGADGEVVPIGRPTDMGVYVVDTTGALAPTGQAGEIWLSGPGVCHGYLNDREHTARKFGTDPFRPSLGGRLFRTGDYGRFNADGVLSFVGRSDDHVKLNGYRLDLPEIETALIAYPQVGAAAAVVHQCPGERDQLVGYVTAREGEQIDPGGLHAHLRSLLPLYMMPSRLVALDAMPLGSTGKTRKESLPAPTADNTLTLHATQESGYDPARERFHRAFAEFLGTLPDNQDLPAAEPNTNLWLGGYLDSFRMIEVLQFVEGYRDAVIILNEDSVGSFDTSDAIFDRYIRQ